jgi:predicted dehydrogenase
MAGHLSQLEVNVEDCATILLRFPDGIQADVHVDFIQRSYSRNCTLAGTEGKLHWDFTANTVQIIRPRSEIETLTFNCEVNGMYMAVLAHFLECVETRVAPQFGLADAILTLRIALAARRAAEERIWVTLD